jgi:uncharacterized protein YdaU (DUF1376 family)
VKLPAFQFYPGDWVQDTRILSLQARGAWIDLLCVMWRSPERGNLTLTYVDYSRIFGTSVDQTKAAISELVEKKICDAVTNGNGTVTLINRRMAREEKERESTRYRVHKFRNKECNAGSNANVTPPSSSSSSSSSSKHKKKIARSVKMADDEFVKVLKQNPAYEGIDIDREIGKLDAWLLTSRGRGKKRTQQRLVNWLNRAEQPMGKSDYIPESILRKIGK